MKEIEAIQSADVVSDQSGRQYHVNLAPGELSEYIILVGESKRARKMSQLLDNIRVEQSHREYTTFTGNYKGTEVSIMSTGIGTSATEIAMIEIFQLAKNPAFIRLGTCGALQPYMNLGDMVISSGAVRLEDTSTFFVHEAYPALAHHEVILSLLHSAEQNNLPYHVGITATSSGFYGAQGRDIPGIPLRNSHIPEEMASMNVINFEMEASTIFNLASFKGCRAGAMCLSIAQRATGGFIDAELREKRENTAIVCVLDALVALAKMDQEKAAKGKKYWVPEL